MIFNVQDFWPIILSFYVSNLFEVKNILLISKDFNIHGQNVFRQYKANMIKSIFSKHFQVHPEIFQHYSPNYDLKFYSLNEIMIKNHYDYEKKENICVFDEIIKDFSKDKVNFDLFKVGLKRVFWDKKETSLTDPKDAEIYDFLLSYLGIIYERNFFGEDVDELLIAIFDMFRFPHFYYIKSNYLLHYFKYFDFQGKDISYSKRFDLDFNGSWTPKGFFDAIMLRRIRLFFGFKPSNLINCFFLNIKRIHFNNASLENIMLNAIIYEFLMHIFLFFYFVLEIIIYMIYLTPCLRNFDLFKALIIFSIGIVIHILEPFILTFIFGSLIKNLLAPPIRKFINIMIYP